MLKANADGLLFGANGKMDPNGKLTRAHIAAIVTRAFGASARADLSLCKDLPAGKWYTEPIEQAVAMGIMPPCDYMEPEAPITRSETFVILAAALGMADGSASALEGFSDAAEIPELKKGKVAAMAAAGYVKGANGKINPNSTITRAEFAALFAQIFARIHRSGDFNDFVAGNLLVTANGATLSYCNIEGNLIIGDGVDSLNLVGVSVSGDILIRGGKDRLDMGGSTTAFGTVIVNNPNAVANIVNSSSIAMNKLECRTPCNTAGNFTNVHTTADINITSGMLTRIDCDSENLKIHSSGIAYYVYANCNTLTLTGSGYNSVILAPGVGGITLNGSPIIATIVGSSLGI